MFQDPPASLSWLFDKTCMLVGIDESHAELGSDTREFMAAVMGSMDGRASQYSAYLELEKASLSFKVRIRPVQHIECLSVQISFGELRH